MTYSTTDVLSSGLNITVPTTSTYDPRPQNPTIQNSKLQRQPIRSRSQVARFRPQRAPLGLERDRADAARAHAERHVVQARERRAHVPPRAGPEQLRRRSRERWGRPVDEIEADLARLLPDTSGPEAPTGRRRRQP